MPESAAKTDLPKPGEYEATGQVPLYELQGTGGIDLFRGAHFRVEKTDPGTVVGSQGLNFPAVNVLYEAKPYRALADVVKMNAKWLK